MQRVIDPGYRFIGTISGDQEQLEELKREWRARVDVWSGIVYLGHDVKFTVIRRPTEWEIKLEKFRRRGRIFHRPREGRDGN